MKTFIIHVSVDAESEVRAKMLVKHCIEAGAVTGCIAPEEGEVAIVLESVDEVDS